MSILEKIVRTENQVQTNIEKAKEKANKLISDAREKSLEKSEEIRIKTNDRLKEINNNLLVEQEKLKEQLKTAVKKQHDETYNLVKTKTKDIVDKMFKEAVK